MNITEEKVDALNARLKIKLSPEDYKYGYENALKTTRKQVQIPGFRPGHVPMSLVKKQYGHSILADEINKVINDSLYKHINDNNLQILGNPLPVKKDNPEGDWDNPKNFEFEYELGLAPEMDLKLEKKKVTYFSINVDDKIIDQQVEDFAKRYGTLSEPEESGEVDLLMGTFVQLNDNREILEGGIMHDGTISIEFIDDKKTKKSLVGLKKGDIVVVNPHKISKGHDDLAKMLRISHEAVHDLQGDFQFKVNEIKRLAAAPVDQSLFDKVYGKDEVMDLEAFRAKVKEGLENNFKKDQDWLFKRHLSTELVEKINPSLPDDFLKRWIMASNENPITEEQLESDYKGYSEGLKWQLIEGKIFKDNNMTVGNEEIEEFAKQNVKAHYAQYGMNLEGDELASVAQNTLNNKDEVRRIYDMLVEEKVMSFCRSQVKVKEKDISFDNFKETVEKLN